MFFIFGFRGWARSAHARPALVRGDAGADSALLDLLISSSLLVSFAPIGQQYAEYMQQHHHHILRSTAFHFVWCTAGAPVPATQFSLYSH